MEINNPPVLALRFYSWYFCATQYGAHINSAAHMKTHFLFVVVFTAAAFSQFPTPLEQSGYTRLTTHSELIDYVQSVSDAVPAIDIEIMATSHGGKQIPAMYISSGAKAPSGIRKLNVLIFAQQHGNEPSGKEGALLLLRDFADGLLNDLLDNVNVILIPQINPDGSDRNIRRNGAGADLNRNHLILTEPEVIGLHALYTKYDPEATLDVHEYSPYGSEWKEWGFREDHDETYGTLTNINTSAELRTMQREGFLPFIGAYLTERGYSFNEYNVGGPPNKERIRNSTVDINDGRQSMGILGSFSMILEGKNGRDSIDNIQRRAEGQYAAMTGFITYIARNVDSIRSAVDRAKQRIRQRHEVAIRMEHVSEGPQPQRYFSYATERETTIVIDNYHTAVESRLSVQQPKGYLIPKSDTLLVELVRKHAMTCTPYAPESGEKVFQYIPEYGAKTLFEEFELPVTSVKKEQIKQIAASQYYYIPVEQRKSSLMTLAFEPLSMINLLQYEKFAYVLKERIWPILRVE